MQCHDVYTGEKDEIFDLCRQFASLKNGKIVLSHDNTDLSVAAAALCVSAVSFSNRRCMYFKNQPQFVTRYAVKTYCASGGIYLYTNEDDKLCMTFIDKDGKTSDFYGGKKVFDTSFLACGIISMVGYKYHYVRKTVSECKNSKLGYRILVSVKNSSVSEMIKLLLEELECEISFYSESTMKSKTENLKKFGEAVREGQYDVGVCIRADGETVLLADENGIIIEEKDFADLCGMTQRKINYVAKEKTCNADTVAGFVHLLDYMKSNEKTLCEMTKNK